MHGCQHLEKAERTPQEGKPNVPIIRLSNHQVAVECRCCTQRNGQQAPSVRSPLPLQTQSVRTGLNPAPPSQGPSGPASLAPVQHPEHPNIYPAKPTLNPKKIHDLKTLSVMLMGGFRGDEDLQEQGNALHAAASSKSSPFVLSSSGRINPSGRHGNQQKPASSASGVGTHRTPG
ncbi:hypothetical protein PCASD_00325 [Puccinia coronata f. sp. avenae]|uniref:Uncharacterized protein n=1 Tax=Puccinia coronata f. sp. avenae TaxID=200324 RepID=A0A2N5VNC1_9BASI|nr:hypothetical protein PCASD_00325 [Puccinia coronata f. sp. avenae]